jgi:hypothetical protein
MNSQQLQNRVEGASRAMNGKSRVFGLVAGLTAVAVLTSTGLAQSSIRPSRVDPTPVKGQVSGAAATGATPAGAAADGRAMRSTGVPARDTLLRMMRPVTIDLTETPLKDVMRFIADVTGADMEVLWVDDRNAEGLEPEHLISVKATNLPALSLLEKVLEKSATDSVGTTGSTWQMSDSGTMQVGPRSRLNRFKRVEIYDITDLLLVLPDYANAPEFDLNSVLQSGEGGGGQSPFQQTQDDDTNRDRRTLAERGQEVIDVIVQLVEPDQWQDNGGDGATIRMFQGSLIVNGPDYVHRAMNGYPYWPARYTSVGQSKGRRWVKLDADSSTAILRDFGTAEVTAVAGGRLIRSGGNPPPGGSTQPAPGTTPAKPKR